MAEGKGDKRSNYPELNTGKRYEINATAKYYCSFYNTSEFPGLLDVASDIKTPMFIISGNKDRLTHVYSHSEIFDLLSENAYNQYRALPGNHKNVLFKNTQNMGDWIESL